VTWNVFILRKKLEVFKYYFYDVMFEGQGKNQRQRVWLQMNVITLKLLYLISFYSKSNKMQQLFKFILFWGQHCACFGDNTVHVLGTTLCMFWGQHCACFEDNTLHVLDGLSIRHQEFKTVHTATGIC
jgi:hypothetical protein